MGMVRMWQASLQARMAGKFTGVAPEATLLAFKVFTTAGITDEDTLIESFLYAYNAGYIFLYVPEVPDNDGVYIGDYTSFWATLQTLPAEAIVSTVLNGGSVTASIPDIAEFVGIFNNQAYTPSYFTSFGGTYDLNLKPDIAAPGSNILSLYLNGGYASMSGTSMACPYIAGVAALYIGEFGGRAIHGPSIAGKVHARILSSGEPLIWGSALGITDKRASATQIGNGLVNATKVLGFDTQLSYSKFVLNDTHHYSRYHRVDITNNAKGEVVYTFEVLPDGGYNSFTAPDASGFEAVGQYFDVMQNPIDIIPQVKLPSGTYKLQPGQTKTGVSYQQSYM
ncbi:putative serin endopeptidase protein [Phaeoacremonium minimum UCRPA7]|uniref:Putative serin endopeptidase protein n=1 Tax=Phaeoacremonium minimum (strain UCR-PA7) TaxID=1286976 RepID=R8BBK3_PHAM7|nr:putative serin endopeptidase protein [Phaeoacremonium minimum UCRPA7]EON96718.1 putative serin endopeptidase protein [Phaeoacremonium minimum UCRPA7]